MTCDLRVTLPVKSLGSSIWQNGKLDFLMEKVWLDILEVSYETRRENDKNLQIS